MSTCKLRVSNAPGPEYALLGLAAVSKNSIVKTTFKAGNREIGYIKGNGYKNFINIFRRTPTPNPSLPNPIRKASYPKAACGLPGSRAVRNALLK